MSAQTPDNQLVECRLLQGEEWQVLESIYPDYLSSGDTDNFSTNRTVKLEVPVELGEEARQVVLYSEGDEQNNPILQNAPKDRDPLTESDVIQRSFLSLSTLPPLLLNLILPIDYPIRRPPIIVSIYASYSWVPRNHLKILERKLLDIWERDAASGEGRAVLYDWIELIRSAEFMTLLGMEDSEGLRIPHAAPTLFSSQLVNFDENVRSARFSQTAYTCEICFGSVKGAKCILLRCQHVFCRACLMEFWQLCIAEGDVDRVGCPDPRCVKDANMADEENVRRVVGTEDEVIRWKWLKEKKELEKDPTVIHCVMPFCQAPVRKPEADDGSGWERLRICPACGYSFCSYCRHSWHGPHTECPLPSMEEFIKEYLQSAEGSSERRALELRYGHRNMNRLIKVYEEDKANREWLQGISKCPQCQVYVEKSQGCNHMTCSRCSTHFCYRCGEKLNGSNPYSHFSNKRHPCYSKLFDYERPEVDEWQPIEGLDL